MNKPIPTEIQSIRVGMVAKIINPDYSEDYPNPVTICGIEWHPVKGENISISNDGGLVGGWKLLDFDLSINSIDSIPKKSFWWSFIASISKKLYFFFHQSEISAKALHLRKMALDCTQEASRNDSGEIYRAGLFDGKASVYNEWSESLRD